MRKRRKFYYLFLVSGWTVLVFHLSSMSYSDQDIRPYLQLFLDEEFIMKWFADVKITYQNQLISVENMGGYAFLEFFFRKGAHLFFYGILGYVTVQYFSSFFTIGSGRIFVLSLMMVSFIALLDEYMQHVHPERNGQWMDVGLDCVGGVFGIVLGLLSSPSVHSKKSADHHI